MSLRRSGLQAPGGLGTPCDKEPSLRAPAALATPTPPRSLTHHFRFHPAPTFLFKSVELEVVPQRWTGQMGHRWGAGGVTPFGLWGLGLILSPACFSHSGGPISSWLSCAMPSVVPIQELAQCSGGEPKMGAKKSPHSSLKSGPECTLGKRSMIVFPINLITKMQLGREARFFGAAGEWESKR